MKLVLIIVPNTQEAIQGKRYFKSSYEKDSDSKVEILSENSCSLRGIHADIIICSPRVNQEFKNFLPLLFRNSSSKLLFAEISQLEFLINGNPSYRI